MYVRLAFAVGAHLEPDILLVDEVLAVGDAAFQDKCLGKMGDVVKRGRTIVFVSHNLAAVRTLCHRVMVLRAGEVETIAPPIDALAVYLNTASESTTAIRPSADDEGCGFTLLNFGQRLRFVCGEPIDLTFEVECPRDFASATAGFVIYDLLDTPVLGASSKIQRVHGVGTARRWSVSCAMGKLPLNSGRYHGTLWFGNEHRDYARFTAAFGLEVIPSDPFGWGDQIPAAWGHLYWAPTWRVLPSQHLGQISHD
jgi:lipopolysaccharide transport system ATP-binding protein